MVVYQVIFLTRPPSKAGQLLTLFETSGKTTMGGGGWEEQALVNDL